MKRAVLLQAPANVPRRARTCQKYMSRGRFTGAVNRFTGTLYVVAVAASLSGSLSPANIRRSYDVAPGTAAQLSSRFFSGVAVEFGARLVGDASVAATAAEGSTARPPRARAAAAPKAASRPLRRIVLTSSLPTSRTRGASLRPSGSAARPRG